MNFRKYKLQLVKYLSCFIKYSFDFGKIIIMLGKKEHLSKIQLADININQNVQQIQMTTL